MEELESIACGFPGVEQAFAIQAGRELRVLASSRDTDDAKADFSAGERRDIQSSAVWRVRSSSATRWAFS